jgi:hypothetical protein
MEHYVALVRLHVLVDDDGTPVKMQYVVRTDGHTVYFNTSNPSLFVIGGPEGGPQRVDIQNGIVDLRGLNFKVVLPKYGVNFHQSGRMLLDLNTGTWTKIGGPNDWLEGNVQALCDALAH